MEPRRRQFLQTQGPVARRGFRLVTQILRAGNFCPFKGVTPVMGSGERRIWTRSVHPEPSPGDPQGELPRRGKRGWPGPLVSFPSLGKKLAPQGETLRRPQAAKFPLRGTKPLYHRPLIRHGFAVPPSPQGEGFLGDYPLIRPLWGHLTLSPLAFGHLPLTRGVGPQGEGFRSAGGENLQRTARLLELQEAKRSFAENFFAYFLFQRK